LLKCRAQAARLVFPPSKFSLHKPPKKKNLQRISKARGGKVSGQGAGGQHPPASIIKGSFEHRKKYREIKLKKAATTITRSEDEVEVGGSSRGSGGD